MSSHPHHPRPSLSTRLIQARHDVARFVAARRAARKPSEHRDPAEKPDRLFPIMLATLTVIAAASLIHLFLTEAG
jgi:hypothetical protein